ncbi:MAG: cobyric acid synthase, partial [Dehalococcoidia bacterium]
MSEHTAKTIMVQGTASHVGKSVVATALCRVFAQDGLRVAPFKAMNMALNSFATLDGGEIGRSTATQAEAAGVTPVVEMNPVLVKPESPDGAQVVVLGVPRHTVTATGYPRLNRKLWPVVTRALDDLRARYDIVVIEGSGSPAEINLKADDIANMRVALHAGSGVLLIGDIDRGGVFASLVGTMALLEPGERALVRAFVINKFRGD